MKHFLPILVSPKITAKCVIIIFTTSRVVALVVVVVVVVSHLSCCGNYLIFFSLKLETVFEFLKLRDARH